MNTEKVKQLTDLRENIDQIDSEIIQLLCKRFEISRNIGIFKKENSVQILDSNREEEVKKSWNNSSHGLNLLPILDSILTVSKQVQTNL